MSTATAIVLGVLLALLLLAIVARRGREPGDPRSQRQTSLDAQERAMATQAEIEEHDIQEMLEARNALRRSKGQRSIGDELAEEIRRDSPSDDRDA